MIYDKALKPLGEGWSPSGFAVIFSIIMLGINTMKWMASCNFAGKPEQKVWKKNQMSEITLF